MWVAWIPWVLPTPTRGRRPAPQRSVQPDREDDLEQVGQHEHRDHHAEQRPANGEGGPAGPPLPGLARRRIPQRDADHDGEQHGRQGQLDGCPGSGPERCLAPAAGTRRGPEVTPEQGGGVGEVLLSSGSVEAVLLRCRRATDSGLAFSPSRLRPDLRAGHGPRRKSGTLDPDERGMIGTGDSRTMNSSMGQRLCPSLCFEPARLRRSGASPVEAHMVTG